MRIGIEMLFDPQTEASVRRLWERLRDEGISSVMLDIGARPHVTLAVYNEEDGEVLREPATRFFAQEPQLEVSLASVGTFPGHQNVVFLAPVVTRDLLALHARWHQAMGALDDAAWPYYRPGRWVPHTTLGILLEDIAVPYALDIARGAGLPIEGRIESAAVYRFEEATLQPVEMLVELPMGG